MTYFGIIFGALFGAFVAYRRNGNKLDMLQYAAGFGIAGGVLAMVLNVIILRFI